MTSKIKVDNINKVSDDSNIINKCGTTITLGASGDSVNLAAGASQTGFGRTGTVDWQTGSIKTATFTAANGEGYFCNTGGGAFEMDLPAGSAGAIVSIQDYNNTFDSYNLTVDPNGTEKINGGDAGETVVLTTKGLGVTFVYIDATVGWRSVQSNEYSTIGQIPTYVAASGGNSCGTSGNYKWHKFTSPGSFVVSCAGNVSGSNTVDYLVVAAGGGGGGDVGNGYGAGAGGAGGYRESSGKASGCYSIGLAPNACVAAEPVTAQSYTITVGGAGTAGATSANGGKGNPSNFSSITSAGGGGGAFGGSSVPAFSGACGSGPGGSGGGGAGPAPTSTGVGVGNTPATSPSQGNSGGNARSPTEPSYGGGGGGGAFAVGQDYACAAPGPRAADGGTGATSSISAAPVAYAGGGGGGTFFNPAWSGRPGGISPCGTGGTGGHSNPSGCVAATAGQINTGGGGGAGASRNPSPAVVAAGAGGSGIVIIRYRYQ